MPSKEDPRPPRCLQLPVPPGLALFLLQVIHLRPTWSARCAPSRTSSQESTWTAMCPRFGRPCVPRPSKRCSTSILVPGSVKQSKALLPAMSHKFPTKRPVEGTLWYEKTLRALACNHCLTSSGGSASSSPSSRMTLLVLAQNPTCCLYIYIYLCVRVCFYIGFHINHRTWGLCHLLPSTLKPLYFLTPIINPTRPCLIIKNKSTVQ